jgi:hypothetical protein
MRIRKTAHERHRRGLNDGVRRFTFLYLALSEYARFAKTLNQHNTVKIAGSNNFIAADEYSIIRAQ